MTDGPTPAMPDTGPFSGSTGTTDPWRMLQTTEPNQRFAFERSIVFARRKATPGPTFYLLSPEINAEQTAGQRIFDAIQALYLSTNTPRDRQIADRITALHRDAIAEGDHISPGSLKQLKDFFLAHPEPAFPKITLTPDGTLRAMDSRTGELCRH